MKIERPQEHYEHARAKHPIFCDCLTHWNTPRETGGQLRVARSALKTATEHGNASALEEVLGCELCEFVDALANGDKEAAIEKTLTEDDFKQFKEIVFTTIAEHAKDIIVETLAHTLTNNLFTYENQRNFGDRFIHAIREQRN